MRFPIFICPHIYILPQTALSLEPHVCSPFKRKFGPFKTLSRHYSRCKQSRIVFQGKMFNKLAVWDYSYNEPVSIYIALFMHIFFKKKKVSSTPTNFAGLDLFIQRHYCSFLQEPSLKLPCNGYNLHKFRRSVDSFSCDCRHGLQQRTSW